MSNKTKYTVMAMGCLACVGSDTSMRKIEYDNDYNLIRTLKSEGKSNDKLANYNGEERSHNCEFGDFEDDGKLDIIINNAHRAKIPAAQIAKERNQLRIK